MNYESVRIRQQSIQERKWTGKTPQDRIFAIEDERDLYRDLLNECMEYLPEINPHGVDKRAVEGVLEG